MARLTAQQNHYARQRASTGWTRIVPLDARDTALRRQERKTARMARMDQILERLTHDPN